MRTRTLIALVVVALIVLAVGMSARGHGHDGLMRRLATAIHGHAGHGGGAH